MNEKGSDYLPAVELATGENPTHAVVWLHGLGADGNDFAPFVTEIDHQGLPPTRFVFPHAPTRPVTINGGYVMRAWYDILSLDFSARREDAESIRESASLVSALLRREEERGVPPSNIVLAGFSQGGAMALHVGLRHPQRLAGLLALSTYLPLGDTVGGEIHSTNRDVPIFQAHGLADDVIPCRIGKQSADWLAGHGLPVEWHEYPTGHNVTLAELRDVERWLQKVLRRPTGPA